MDNSLLPEFSLAPSTHGWTGKFPGGHHFLFGKEVQLEIHTRLSPKKPRELPPISERQANLVRAIAPSLPEFINRVEKELTDYEGEFDPKFREFIDHPYVWLNCENNDGVSWTFVVGRTDNPDFGFHSEFRGSEFIELWAGD